MTAYIVSSGQVTSAITLSSGDTETVLAGGIAFATTIDSGGSLTVSAGGSAGVTTIASGGSAIVLSSGIAASTTIDSGGSMTVSGDSAEFDGGTINGSLTVLAGGEATAVINSGGSEAVLTGGTASFDTINAGGSMTVSGGISESDTIIGSLTVADGLAGAEGFHGEGFDLVDSGGSLTVSAGGSAAVFINSGGSGTVLSGGIAASTTIDSGGSLTVSGGVAKSDTVDGSLTVLAGGIASNTMIDSGASLTVSAGGIALAITINSGGSETVLAGGVVASGLMIFGSGAVLDLLSGAVVSGGISFPSTGGQLQIGGSAMPSSTISGFVPGDTFDLTSIAFDSSGMANVGTGAVLQIAEGGNTYDLNLYPAQFYDFFHLASDGSSGTLVSESTTPCYCRGTLILTEAGELPIEDLAIGDRVVTLSGVARPIVWIGRRSYARRFALGQGHILPVRIAAGALADGVPRRDLWISPNHALYLEAVLIEARDLVNGVSIVQAERVEAIDYFHLELDSHDLIVAEGAAAESFIDDDSRGLFHNANEYRVLYPDAPAGPARYCAPRRDQGYEVERARTRIARRARLAVAAEAPPLGRLRGQIEEVGLARRRQPGR